MTRPTSTVIFLLKVQLGWVQGVASNLASKFRPKPSGGGGPYGSGGPKSPDSGGPRNYKGLSGPDGGGSASLDVGSDGNEHGGLSSGASGEGNPAGYGSGGPNNHRGSRSYRALGPRLIDRNALGEMAREKRAAKERTRGRMRNKDRYQIPLDLDV